MTDKPKSFHEAMGEVWEASNFIKETAMAYDAAGNYCFVKVTVNAKAPDGSLWEGTKQLRLQMKRV